MLIRLSICFHDSFVPISFFGVGIFILIVHFPDLCLLVAFLTRQQMMLSCFAYIMYLFS